MYLEVKWRKIHAPGFAGKNYSQFVASAYECFRDDWGLIMINNASKKYGPKLEHSDIIKRSKPENIDVMHGLHAPNEDINQRNLKFWADVAEKICLGHTYKFGIWF